MSSANDKIMLMTLYGYGTRQFHTVSAHCGMAREVNDLVVGGQIAISIEN